MIAGVALKMVVFPVELCCVRSAVGMGVALVLFCLLTRCMRVTSWTLRIRFRYQQLRCIHGSLVLRMVQTDAPHSLDYDSDDSETLSARCIE